MHIPTPMNIDMNINRSTSPRAAQRLMAAAALAGLAALAGCASPGAVAVPGAAAASPLYRCGPGQSFSVSFSDDSAALKGPRGNELLLRDAGGQGEQKVYSNARLRAQFGLGASGRDALLHYLGEPLKLRCQRD